MTSISFSWLDAVDILLVTVLIYCVILYVRGTRAVAALNGLFVLLAVYIAAQAIGLYTLVWIFENLFSSLFLVLVILFSEDIRQGLSTLSIQSMFTFLKKDTTTSNLVSTLTETCFILSKKYIGAIIVLEMKMPLGDITEKGVEIDARLSQDLLATLFFPKTPLHDGAVIIDKKERIKAAGCILPLASIDRQHFGTRHRAALGITDVSDALAIVVSEERGEVTIAQKGQLSAPLTREAFERVLRNAIK